MNERFVCIKVDREERPDVDAICMEACQAMTGQGGWPLNAFLTPDKAPFYAGTYFPPEPRHGLPSWQMVLTAVADAWDTKRDQMRQQSAQIVEALNATARAGPVGGADPRRAGARGGDSAGVVLRRRQRRFRPRAQVPARLGDRAAAGSRRAGDVAGDAGGDGGAAGSTTRLAAASPATRSTRRGRCRTSRRCSTTTRCWPGRICTAGRSQARSASARSAARRSTGRSARCAGRRAGSARRWTPTPRASRASSTCGRPEELRDALGPALAEPAIAYFGVRPAGNFEHGTSVLEARGPVPERAP